MKRLYVFVVCFFLAFNLAAQDSGFHFKEIFSSPVQNAQLSLGLNTLEGFSSAQWIFDAAYNIYNDNFSANCGFEAKYGNFQFTFKPLFWFFKMQKFKIGANIIYNLDFYQNISVTSNILLGVDLFWNPIKWYKISFTADYFLKLRTIHAIEAYKPCLVNNTLAFVFSNTFILPKNFSVILELSSIEPFRLLILGAPSFTIGTMYSIKNKIDIIAKATVRYIDFFTISSHYEESLYSLGVRYSW